MTRLGCRLPNMGDLPARVGMAEMAKVAEEAGADSLHLSDHLVVPEVNESTYPFSDDGRFPFAPDADWYEVLISCAWVAAQAPSLEVGPSVLVLPQRNPLELAKATATISQITGGRFFLGAGAGWLREEFVALGYDFDARGRVMEEALEILRLAWSGTAKGFDGEHFRVPEGTHCRPLPSGGDVPVLLGGMSKAALRRAARAADGWIALMQVRDDPAPIGRKLRQLHELRAEHGADGAFRAVIRLVNYGAPASDLGGLVRELVGFGFGEVVIDAGWDDLPKAAEAISAYRRLLDDLD